MSGKHLVIVESPTKAKTIKKFLGKDYIIKASNGHVRDLPRNASEVPAKIKKEKWSSLGVNVDKDFEPTYIIPKNKKDHVKELKSHLAKAETLYLATDEDREGESISWHLLEILKPKIPVKRLVFHEITKEAIQSSLDNARELDEDLVRAQETRRIIDRLFGYKLSELLWRKIRPKLSAGRVQSTAIRLLVERERERIIFKKAIYWGLKASFLKNSDDFEAELTHYKEKRIATGKDFDPHTGKLLKADKILALSEKEAKDIKKKVEDGIPEVTSVEEKPFTSKPAPPFTTSTLQQEGNRKLRFSARHTMSVAQQLYENGFITYMRTDSTTLSNEALEAARGFIKKDYGKDFLPDEARIYTTKVKNAQEAHEAIRPAGIKFTPPEDVKTKLGTEAFRLYDLIWKRTVASQMKNATGTHISVHVEVEGAKFRAAGKTITFPGYLRAYVEGSDDPDADLADQEKYLPKLAEKDKLKTKQADEIERSTQPPARYTEGSLIKELERLGIGRPSTWATVVELVLNREYAFKKGSALVPSFTALSVVSLLENHFQNIVDYDFTAKLEDDLDAISRGEEHNIKYLKNFYFGNGHPGLITLVEKGMENIDPRIVCGIPLGTTDEGVNVEVRIGRYGPFITNGEHRASVPEGVAPDELTLDSAVETLEIASRAPESLGEHPETSKPIYLKAGPYGPYVQHGDQEEGSKKKPKMASLLSNMSPDEVTLDEAVKLLSLPIDLGEHPELKHPIIAANGRFGPYIKCDSETRSINLEEYSPITITKEQAITLLAQPKKSRRPAKPKALKELGAHPESELAVSVRTGRYGPYVSDGQVNATLPKGTDPMEVTMEQAVDLLLIRREKLGKKTPKPKKKASTKKKTEEKSETKTKKTATKKTAAKKKSEEKKDSPKTKAAPKSKAKATKKNSAKK